MRLKGNMKLADATESSRREVGEVGKAAGATIISAGNGDDAQMHKHKLLIFA